MRFNLSQTSKSTLISPFLFSCLPIMFLLSFNAHELPVSDVIIPLIISISIAFIIWIIIRLFLEDKKSSLIVSLFAILFAIYGNVHTQSQVSTSELIQLFGSNLISGPIFLLIGILGTIFFVKTKSAKEINTIFNVVSLTIILILISNTAIYYISNTTPYDSSEFLSTPVIISDVDYKPTVFVLILDEFAGKHQLEMDFEYDLTPFNDELKERNFLVPEISIANYPNTSLGRPSFMNMDYINTVAAKVGPDSKDMRIPLELTEKNHLFKMFKANGYKITTFFAGLHAPGDTLYVDEKLCSFGTINTDLRKNFVNTYLPLSYFDSQLLQLFHHEKLQCVFSYIENYQSNSEQPHLVFAHMRLPHHPYIYDEHGNYYNWEQYRGPPDSHKPSYLNQLKFSEKKVLDLIDHIQHNHPNSVIILHSDHGYRSDINWSNPTDDDIIRGFDIISALYFPEKETVLPDRLSLVNLYRIFFNVYFDAEYEILDNKHYWFDPLRPFLLHDVTALVNSKII